jgi:hypothetical protein
MSDMSDFCRIMSNMDNVENWIRILTSILKMNMNTYFILMFLVDTNTDSFVSRHLTPSFVLHKGFIPQRTDVCVVVERLLWPSQFAVVKKSLASPTSNHKSKVNLVSHVLQCHYIWMG